VIAYVDTSVVLRVILGSSGALANWIDIEEYKSSVLLRVECLRSLERMRLAEHKPADEIAIRRKAVDDLMLAADLFDVTSDVLLRAGAPFIAPLKTLDAIHLATALECRKESRHLAFATHDKQLARAARAVGFLVLGAYGN
jgi:predicted nucleic acid-binding protein